MRNFEMLCKENYTRIYRYIYGMTGSRETAEDLIQDVFTVAVAKGEAFIHHENPPAFLYRTARNLTLTYLSRRQRLLTEFLDENIPGDEEDLSDKLLRAHDRQIDETAYVGQVLGLLNDSQQTLYRKRYIEDRPIREIALELGASEPAMRMRLVRLRRDIHDAVRALRLDEK